MVCTKCMTVVMVECMMVVIDGEMVDKMCKMVKVSKCRIMDMKSEMVVKAKCKVMAMYMKERMIELVCVKGLQVVMVCMRCMMNVMCMKCVMKEKVKCRMVERLDLVDMTGIEEVVM